MLKFNLRFLQKMYVGVYPAPPFCYLVGLRIAKNGNFIIDFKNKIFIKDFYKQSFFIYISCVPLSLINFEVLPSDLSESGFGFYLGLKQGQSYWMYTKMDQMRFSEYFIRLGNIPQACEILEIDALSLWHYAYWQLPQINGYHQVILWIYKHCHGYYLLLGRNDMLWELHDLDSLSLLETWLKVSKWPLPHKIVCINFYLLLSHLAIPALYLNVEEEPWTIALALALRGGYAAI